MKFSYLYKIGLKWVSNFTHAVEKISGNRNKLIHELIHGWISLEVECKVIENFFISCKQVSILYISLHNYNFEMTQLRYLDSIILCHFQKRRNLAKKS